MTRPQLLHCGLSSDVIDHRVKAGKLIPVHAGVYAIGVRRLDPPARAAAAVLACGPGALLSHSWAAALWGLHKDWPGLPEVTIPRDRRPKGVRFHRSATLTRADERIHLGIRVTSPARTIVDNAPGLTDQQLRRAIRELRLQGYLKPSELAEAVERLRSSRLRPFVDNPTGPTRSEFEDAFLAFVAEFNLPRPRVNRKRNGREVDMVFDHHKVIVELDGYEFHRDRDSFNTDRDNDAEALSHGFVTMRVTWDRLHGQGRRAAEARRLQRILQQRG